MGYITHRTREEREVPKAVATGARGAVTRRDPAAALQKCRPTAEALSLQALIYDGGPDTKAATVCVRLLVADLPSQGRANESIEALVESLFFEDRAQGEIAAAPGVPLSIVKSRSRLAIARLRALLGDMS